MKKLLLFLLTFPFLFTACSEDEIPMFGSVYGVVSDSATGQPISGASITLSPGNFTYVTGSDGHYQFTDLEAGSYKVNCLANGYNANSRQITIYAGGNSTCDFLLTKQTSVSGISLSTNSIDFGNKLSEQVFSIINTGNAGEVSWTISNTASWISVTPVSGSVAQGKSSSVTVKIDRSKITQDETSYITVNAAGGSLAVMVTVNCNNGGNGDNGDNGGNGDNGANGSGEAVLGFDTTTLDFGTTETELSFIVANMDEATANLRWEIDSDYHQWLSVSKTSGELEPGYYHTVTVTLNRAAMTSSFETKLKVYDLAENYEYYYPITVTAKMEDYSSATITSCDYRVDAKIVSCRRTGSTVVLSYVLTNTKIDPTLYLEMAAIGSGQSWRSTAYDNLGNEYYKSDFTLRDQSANQNNYKLGVYLPMEMPCKGTIVIPNVDASATSLTYLLNVWYWNYDIGIHNTPATINFKNVPIY